jgi:hypothetical protein
MIHLSLVKSETIQNITHTSRLLLEHLTEVIYMHTLPHVTASSTTIERVLSLRTVSLHVTLTSILPMH